MKKLVVILALVALTGAAAAEKPIFDDPGGHIDMQCDLTNVVYDWDFATGDHGFTAGICEVGGSASWAHGPTTYIPGAPGTVWGTVLNGDYANDTGAGLTSPTFTVDASTMLMEIYHYYDVESNYDGGNVSVGGSVITPMAGYTGTLSTSTSYYAWCVDMEPGWSGSGGWSYACFDLSGFTGQDIQVEFDFGTDSSVTYPGWYIASVKIGNTDPTAYEGNTWGRIKGMFH